VRSLAVLSLHTSPLTQPGTGDGGGMNVYVRELSSHLARAGVRVEVFTRAESVAELGTVAVEPNFRVHRLLAGPAAAVPKERLPALVSEWTAGVRRWLVDDPRGPVEVIHANYWLSGVAGHRLKHELGVPLISTFHTLDRVKAEASPEEQAAAEPARRAEAEAEIVGCSDAVLASCDAEADQLVGLYAAEPGRIEIVAPGVEHAFFTPGDQGQARRALGFPAGDPMVLFVGRIQPLKGLSVAVEALAQLRARPGLASTRLVVVGGPSGPHGPAEQRAVHDLVARRGLAGAVDFVAPQPHEMLSTYYRAADVCVVPSRSESFGLVALEAAACGVPVVAAGVGGLPSLVDHGRSGFLVEDRDLADYAAHLACILLDGDRAARLGWAGRERAAAYTWKAAAGALRDLGQRLTLGELVAC
jgi:D-inositol-3-phosphate glycosyltransferase